MEHNRNIILNNTYAVRENCALIKQQTSAVNTSRSGSKNSQLTWRRLQKGNAGRDVASARKIVSLVVEVKRDGDAWCREVKLKIHINRVHVCEFAILYFYVNFSLVNSFCFRLHSIALHWTVVSIKRRLYCWLVSKQTKLQLTNVYRMLAKQPFFSDFQKQHDLIIAIFSVATTYFHSSAAKTFMFVFFLFVVE